MASPEQREAAGRALAVYAEKVEPAALKVSWTDAVRRLGEPTPDWLAAPSLENLRAVQAWLAQFQADTSFLLESKWVDQVASRMSSTYVTRLRKERELVGKDCRRVVDELTAAAAERGATLGPAALSGSLTAFEPLILAALIFALKTYDGPEAERRRYAEAAMRATLDPPPPPARPAEAAPVHPLLQMGLTYGVAPAAVERAEGSCAYDAAVPGAPAIFYDLQTLLTGVAGTPVSGLNFTLVAALDTIRPAVSAPQAVEPASPALPAGLVPLRCRRRDADGVYRALVACGGPDETPTVEKMLRGPQPLLGAYNELAAAALHPATLETHGLLERFEVAAAQPTGPYSAEAAAGREAIPLGKYYAQSELLGSRGAAQAAGSAVAASRYASAPASVTSLTALPGVAAAYNEELALTALLGGLRIQDAWHALPPGPPAAAHASPVLTLLRSDAGAAPSLKLYAARHARPASL